VAESTLPFLKRDTCFCFFQNTASFPEAPCRGFSTEQSPLPLYHHRWPQPSTTERQQKSTLTPQQTTHIPNPAGAYPCRMTPLHERHVQCFPKGEFWWDTVIAVFWAFLLLSSPPHPPPIFPFLSPKYALCFFHAPDAIPLTNIRPLQILPFQGPQRCFENGLEFVLGVFF